MYSHSLTRDFPLTSHPGCECQQFHGPGILQKPAAGAAARNAEVYSGEFDAGSEHGVGVLVSSAGTYKGEFVNGQKSGSGLEVLKTGERFMGTFLKDKRHGIGLIQARGHRRGQVVLERWENGVCTNEGAAVTRDFVGGAAEAAAQLTTTAFNSVAAIAERKALLARECSQTDENNPPPPLSALGLQHGRIQRNLPEMVESPTTNSSGSDKNGDTRRNASVSVKKNELARVLEQQLTDSIRKEAVDLRSENKKLNEQAEQLKATIREEQIARAALGKELVRLELNSSAQIEAQEEHFIAVRKQYAHEHQRRLQEVGARFEKEIQMLEKEIDYLKNRKESSSVNKQGTNATHASSTAEKDTLEFKVVPLGGKIMSERDKELPDKSLLNGPRQFATFGGRLEWGVHAYILKVESLTGSVDGYVGIASARNSAHTVGFSLLCDDDTLGKGTFGAMDSIDQSHRVDDGQSVLLQIDADGEMMSLFTTHSEPKLLATSTIDIDKPWTAAVMLTAPSSSIRLIGKRKGGVQKQGGGVVMERVMHNWHVRSLRSGIEYSTLQVLFFSQSPLIPLSLS